MLQEFLVQQVIILYQMFYVLYYLELCKVL